MRRERKSKKVMNSFRTVLNPLKKLTALLLLIGIAMVGCKKNNIEHTKTFNNTLFNSIQTETINYGWLHNEIADYILTECEYFFNDLQECDYISSQDILQLLELSKGYFLINNQLEDINLINQEIAIVSNLVDSLGDDEDGRANILKIFRTPDSTSISNLFLSFGYSAEFIDFIYPCIKISAINPFISHNEIMNDYLLPLYTHSFTSSFDEFAAKNVFFSVYEHSAYFWNDEPIVYSMHNDSTKQRNPNLPPHIHDCVEWAMIMDAVGTIYGSAFTIIGSAVLGAILSIAAKRDCERDGIYC